MTLVRTKPNKNRYQGLFDHLFSPELSELRRDNYFPAHTSLPKVNIKEEANEFVLEIAAPGMEKNDFKIQLDQDLLTVSSDKKEENFQEEKSYSKREFSYEPFQRKFTLPDLADADKINASYLNGVLLVHIPKKEEAKPQPRKRIEVK